MTVYVYRDGKLVEKGERLKTAPRLDREGRVIGHSLLEPLPLCAPYVSRMEPFESPVTGAEITSWRQRDAEMRAVDAVDPRDFPRDHALRRGRAVQLKEDEPYGRPEPER